MNQIQLDVLREIGNIGVGNATTALAQLLSIRIDMDVPTVRLLSFPELGSAIGSEEEEIVGVYLEVSGEINGSIMFLMKKEPAKYLIHKLIFDESMLSKEGECFTEMELSALKEIGNIITGSYLNAISTLTSLKASPSIPAIAVDMAAAILSVPATHFGQYDDHALLIQTKLESDKDFYGYFILLPEMESYEKILNSLGIEM